MTVYTATATRPRRYRGTHRPGRRARAQRSEVGHITGAWRVAPPADGRHEAGPGTDPHQLASVRRDTELIDGAALAAQLDTDTTQSTDRPTQETTR